MRTASMIVLFVLAAATCHADDPLESLNTVQETLSQLAHYRATHSSSPPAATTQSQSPVADASGEAGTPDTLKEPPVAGEGSASCCQDQAH